MRNEVSKADGEDNKYEVISELTNQLQSLEEVKAQAEEVGRLEVFL